MRKLTLYIITAMTFCLSASAQEKLAREILGKLDSNRVEFTYSCTMNEDVPVRLDGSIIAQGECYLAKGNGLEIYSDGKMRWTVDHQAKEVYIEVAGGIKEILDNSDAVKDLRISNLKYLPFQEETRIFTFDTSKLDASWVVTDLRQE